MDSEYQVFQTESTGVSQPDDRRVAVRMSDGASTASSDRDGGASRASMVVDASVTHQAGSVNLTDLDETLGGAYGAFSQSNPTPSLIGSTAPEHRAAVGAFFVRHLFLFPLVTEAALEVSSVFIDCDLHLKIVTDPEWPEEAQLVLFVVSDLSVGDSYALLRRFDDEWWIDNMDRARGRFLVNLDFA